jgi:hypothetical protein
VILIKDNIFYHFVKQHLPKFSLQNTRLDDAVPKSHFSNKIEVTKDKECPNQSGAPFDRVSIGVSDYKNVLTVLKLGVFQAFLILLVTPEDPLDDPGLAMLDLFKGYLFHSPESTL